MLKKLLGVISISIFKEIWKLMNFLRKIGDLPLGKNFYQNSLKESKNLSWEGEGRRTSFSLSLVRFGESGLVG